MHLHHILEDPWVDEEMACRTLLGIMGTPAPESGPIDAGRVIEILAFDPEDTCSIVGSLNAARDNARGARDAISSEMWECLNATYNALPAQTATDGGFGPHRFFRFVKERAAVLAGLADSTMSRDDGWRFLVLGRSLERVDMTSRLLLATISSGSGSPEWINTLRSCSAYEAFLRTYRSPVEASPAVEFLLLDRLFPRSAFHALLLAQQCLSELGPTIGRSGTEDEARRILGLARTELEFRRVDELVADLRVAPRAPPGRLRRRRHRGRAALLPPDRRHRMDPRRSLRPVSWRIAIRHRTGYHYSGGATSSYNEVRITPLTTDRQTVMEAMVSISPAVPTLRYIDYWGTFVDAFDVQEPHTDMVVTGTSVVETSALPGPVSGIGWDDLARHEVRDRYAELLAPTLRVPITGEVAEAARTLADGLSPVDACVAATEWVRSRLRYQPGTTDSSTSAIEALRRGSGVCQDFVHLSLAVLRAMGIPARYTSGYLHPSPEADIGLTVRRTKPRLAGGMDR